MPTEPLIYLLEVNICLIAFYLFYRMLLQKEVFFLWNRLFITMAVVLSLILPLIDIPLSPEVKYLPSKANLPALTILTADEESAGQPQVILSANENDHAIAPAQYIWLAYVIMCMLLLAKLIWQVGRLWLFAYTHAYSQHKAYKLIYTNGKLPTCSFFRLLFWDNSQALSEAKQTVILQHELAHIRQWHSVDAMLIELLKVFCWFNPVVYLFKKSLEEVHEYMADAAVTQQYDALQYSQVMAEQVFMSMNLSFTQSFNRSLINKRIAMIQSTKAAKPAPWKMALSLPVVGILFFLYSCRTGEVVPTQGAQVTTAGMYRMGEVVVVGYATSPAPQNPPKIKEYHLKFNKYNMPVPLHKMEEVVYESVDETPSPANGMDSFQETIREAINLGGTKRSGTILVQAIIDEAGNLVKPYVPLGIDVESSANILKVLENSPKWTPGKIKGNPVTTKVSFYVTFNKPSTSYTSLVELQELSKTPQSGQPVPQEGIEAFYKHIQKYIKYPTEARRHLIEGQVVVAFTIQKDGRLANLEVIESLFPALDVEVFRVVHESKSTLLWKPAMQNGQAQESRIVLPVTFKLG
jgi:TonB family protein